MSNAEAKATQAAPLTQDEAMRWRQIHSWIYDLAWKWTQDQIRLGRRPPANLAEGAKLFRLHLEGRK